MQKVHLCPRSSWVLGLNLFEFLIDEFLDATILLLVGTHRAECLFPCRLDSGLLRLFKDSLLKGFRDQLLYRYTLLGGQRLGAPKQLIGNLHGGLDGSR